MYSLTRTNSNNTDFQKLVKELDKDLAIRDGDEHSFFAQFNKTDTIKYVVLAYEGEMVIGCGAIKEYDKDIMEVKRMYVPVEKRGKGIASLILKELEQWAKEWLTKNVFLKPARNNRRPSVFIRKKIIIL